MRGSVMSVYSGFFTVFAAVLLAELGDKTQIATLLFTIRGDNSPLLVFFAAAAALTLASAIAVGAGALATRYLDMVPLKLISGVVFVALGLWTIVGHFRA